MCKRRTVYLACLGMLMLCGCESVELEQRSFPLAVGIDLQKTEDKGKKKEQNPAIEDRALIVSFDFPDLAQISEKDKTTDTPMGLSLEGIDMYHVEKSFENNTNRVLDYNHMKAIVLGKNMFEDQRQLRSLLLAWEQREASARNTSLLIGSESAAEILSLTEETEGSMGKYLEEMLESQKDFKQNKIATIGDLMNQWHNQDQLLLIPVLTEQGNRPTITKYAAVLNFSYRGMLTVEEAMEVFFCQGLLEKFTVEPAKNEVVEISDIQVNMSIKRQNETPTVTVSISGKGKLKTGQVSSTQQQYQMEQKIEQHLTKDLQATAEKLTEKFGMDMTNSYLSLGGLDRELYNIYENLPDMYNEKVQHIFEVDINLMNWE